MAAVSGTGDLTSSKATLAGVASLGKHATGALSSPHVLLAGAAARAYFASGELISPSVQILAETNVPDPTIWETDNQPWGAADFAYAANKPVMIIGNEFFQADRDLRFGEISLRAVLMRSGLTIMGRDRFGNWKSDPRSMKEAQKLWPIIRGTPGTIISVYLGAQEATDDPIFWEGPFPYIIGTTVFCDFTVTGRYLAVRFESQDAEPWELLSYDLDLEFVGETG